ncbi:hypothetical protein M426DRAFT_322548 [Hypoxylon sp. CI-4A]|nr:hypothetical protein M426DRAFT_322548 [Hypoxylon sp. CI-4A]
MNSERIKELEQAEEELRLRRERGRLAQRAFRNRKRQRAQPTKRDEVQRLREALRRIEQEARDDDRPELLRAIREAAEVTGFDTVEDTERGNAGEEPIAAPLLPSQDATNAVSATGAPSTQEVAIIPQITPDNRGGFVRMLDCWETTSRAAKPGPAKMDVRLDYGLWFDAWRFMRTDSPPLDIVPYLGKGMKTFAGHLFWSCGQYLLDLCRKVDSYGDSTEARIRIWNMVQHSKSLHNVRYIRALAEARREYRDRGFIEGNNPAGESDSGQVLNDHVLADYRTRGEDVGIWLSPRAVEHELRKRLSHESFRRLEHGLELWSSKELEDPLVEVVKPLIQTLSTTFICFGDGPRWRADRVDALLKGNT